MTDIYRYQSPNNGTQFLSHTNNGFHTGIRTAVNAPSWQNEPTNSQRPDLIGSNGRRTGSFDATFSSLSESDRTIINYHSRLHSSSTGYISDDRSSYSNTSEVLTTDEDVITPINNGSPVLANQKLSLLDEPIYYDDDLNIKSRDKYRNLPLLNSTSGNSGKRNDLILNAPPRFHSSSPEITPLNSPALDDRKGKLKFPTMRVKDENKARKFQSYTPPPTSQSSSSKRFDKSFSYDDRLHDYKYKRSLETLHSVFESQQSSISPSDAPLISRPVSPPTLSYRHPVPQISRSVSPTMKSFFNDDLTHSRSNSASTRSPGAYIDRSHHVNDPSRSTRTLTFSIPLPTDKLFDSFKKRSKDQHPIYLKAINALDSMQFNEAISLFTQVLSIYPQSYSLICYRAYASYQAESWNQAISDLNRAIAKKPRRSRAYSLRGEVYRRLNRFDESLSDLNMSLKLKKNIYALRARAEVYSSMDRFYDAINDLDSVLEIDPKNILAIVRRAKAYCSLGLYQDALSDLELALNFDPVNTSSILMNRGEIYRLMGRYDLALLDFNASLQSEENLFALERRGIVYKFLKKDRDALADYTRVLQLDSKNFSAHKGRAEILYNMGNREEALVHMNLALQIEPFDFSLLKGRGKINQELGSMDNALTDYNLALRIFQNDVEVLINRGEIFRTTGKYDKAIQDFTKVLEIDSKQVRALS
ncbi:17087_t:CDS:1, partial [Racocetra fulgida]